MVRANDPYWWNKYSSLQGTLLDLETEKEWPYGFCWYVLCIIKYALWFFDHNVLCLSVVTVFLDTTFLLEYCSLLLFCFMLCGSRGRVSPTWYQIYWFWSSLLFVNCIELDPDFINSGAEYLSTNTSSWIQNICLVRMMTSK